MADQPEELVITLKKPLKSRAGVEVAEITLREPTAGEWKTWDKLSGVEADIAAIAKVAGQPPYLIEEMAASQVVEASRYLAGFIRAGQPTGGSE